MVSRHGPGLGRGEGAALGWGCRDAGEAWTRAGPFAQVVSPA